MEKIREILAEALMIDESDINDAMEFRKSPAWDSLAMLTLIASLSDEYGVEVTDKDIKALRTVAELIELIEEKKR